MLADTAPSAFFALAALSVVNTKKYFTFEHARAVFCVVSDPLLSFPPARVDRALVVVVFARHTDRRIVVVFARRTDRWIVVVVVAVLQLLDGQLLLRTDRPLPRCHRSIYFFY